MKKIMLLLLLMISFAKISYSLEVYRADNLNFGKVVKGDRRVTLKNVKLRVKGDPNKRVEINLDKRIRTDIGVIEFYLREETIRLDSNGRGYFSVTCKLDPKDNKLGRLQDDIRFRVRYK